MIIKPKWLRMIPKRLRPADQKVRKLEKIRSEYRIPHEEFATGILSSPATTKAVQHRLYEETKIKMPGASDRELLTHVLASRAIPPEPYGYGMTEEELDEAMKSIYTVDDLVKYVISKEPRSQALRDLSEIGRTIDDILEG